MNDFELSSTPRTSAQAPQSLRKAYQAPTLVVLDINTGTDVKTAISPETVVPGITEPS